MTVDFADYFWVSFHYSKESFVFLSSLNFISFYKPWLPYQVSFVILAFGLFPLATLYDTHIIGFLTSRSLLYETESFYFQVYKWLPVGLYAIGFFFHLETWINNNKFLRTFRAENSKRFCVLEIDPGKISYEMFIL